MNLMSVVELLRATFLIWWIYAFWCILSRRRHVIADNGKEYRYLICLCVFYTEELLFAVISFTVSFTYNRVPCNAHTIAYNFNSNDNDILTRQASTMPAMCNMHYRCLTKISIFNLWCTIFNLLILHSGTSTQASANLISSKRWHYLCYRPYVHIHARARTTAHMSNGQRSYASPQHGQ